ncbi:aminoglycoside phosphotransferase family protein [Candidatus Sumerlaeota bacterium]
MAIDAVERIIDAHELLGGVERTEFLDRGYSDDKKYVLWTKGAPSYLVRLSELKFTERRRKDFDLMKLHHERGVPCSEPLIFGADEESGLCFSVFCYIQGECAEEALPLLAEREQFDVGVAAGHWLRKMHEVPHPDPDFDWPAHRRAKYERQSEDIRKHNFAFHGREALAKYVESNLQLLDQAPVRFQHDDYHPGNLIVLDGRLAGIIDFNRCDWGDPLEDFYKVPWFSSPVSVPFARGQVLGYAEDGMPENFWRRYNLYLAMMLGVALVWAHHHQPENFDPWQRQIKEIVETHDFKSGGPPTWFSD